MCKYNCNIIVDIRYKRNSTWGWNPHVEVLADLDGVRTDVSRGSASGCGYDKNSAAVCYAFRENPLLETLALWDGFNPNKPEYGPERCHDTGHGYRYAFDGQGLGVFEDLMIANGFTMVRREDYGDRMFYHFGRLMPESFSNLF